MRTFEEILAEIKSAFISNTVLRSAYKLSAAKTFDEQFSAVSVESALVYIAASVAYVLERTVYTVLDAVQTSLDSRVLYGEQWYYDKALAYQDGYPLVYDSATFGYRYEKEDETARIVKFAAARQVTDDSGRASVRIMVSGEDKEPLGSDALGRFTAYMRRIAPAGITMTIVSQAAVSLQVSAQIFYDPLLLDDSGQLVTGTAKPVETAIKEYVDGIKYGGVFNKTRLVDAIQTAEGVRDVILRSVSYRTGTSGSFTTLSGNSLAADSGCFAVQAMNIEYLSADNE